MPNEIVLPNLVFNRSLVEIKQSKPIRNTINAIKNVWIVNNWRLIKLKDFKSSFQLKYLGKMACTSASKISSTPIILR